uniref:CUB domain-containing protein n=1 Tax=Ascaris lumbricoides TaxID=6252 RepID=A0A0M3IL99_ASCLU
MLDVNVLIRLFHFYERPIIESYRLLIIQDIIARIWIALGSCTGTNECDFTSNGQYLTIRFVSAEGEPDRYGFRGTAALYSPYRQKMAAMFKYKVAGAIGIAAFFILIVGGSVVLYALNRMKSRSKKQKETNAAVKDKLIEH